MRTGIVVTARPGSRRPRRPGRGTRVHQLLGLRHADGQRGSVRLPGPVRQGDECDQAGDRRHLSGAAIGAGGRRRGVEPERDRARPGDLRRRHRQHGPPHARHAADDDGATRGRSRVRCRTSPPGGRPAYTEGTRTRDIRFLHVGPYVNTQDPVEFVVAAFGLKAAAIAGRLGAGVISFGLLAPDRVDGVSRDTACRRPWAPASRPTPTPTS